MVRAAQQGDRDAFGALYERFSGYVYAILLTRLSRDAATDLIKAGDPEAAGPQPVEQVLYVVARDNVEQWMVQILIDHPKWLHAVAKASLEFDDPDARWQLAVALGASSNKAEAEQLLLRYYEPASGQVLVDGAPLQGFTLDSLRGHLGYVSQEAFLFSGSVAERLVKMACS